MAIFNKAVKAKKLPLVNQLFQWAIFQFANCKRLPGRVNGLINQDVNRPGGMRKTA
jgi:hypothetical protein